MKKALLTLGFLFGCVNSSPPYYIKNAITPQEIFTTIAKSSVVIETPVGLGSGTVVWTDGGGLSLILTCHHVIYDEETNKPFDELSISSLQAGSAVGIVEDFSEDADLALVMGMGDLKAPALLVAIKEPDLYEHLYVMGAPAGYHGTAAEATLTNKQGFWQLTSFIFPGYSGGTVTNNRMELVAVPRMVYAGVNPYGVPEIVPEIGFVVPLPMIRTFLKSYPMLVSRGR